MRKKEKVIAEFKERYPSDYNDLIAIVYGMPNKDLDKLVEVVRYMVEKEKSRVKKSDISQVSRLDEIREDHYYLYPSHAESEALIFAGSDILELQEFGKDLAACAIAHAAFISGMLIQKYHPEYAHKILHEGVWDLPDRSVDQALMEAAVQEFKERFHVIEYGSEVHNFLCELVVQE